MVIVDNDGGEDDDDEDDDNLLEMGNLAWNAKSFCFKLWCLPFLFVIRM